MSSEQKASSSSGASASGRYRGPKPPPPGAPRRRPTPAPPAPADRRRETVRAAVFYFLATVVLSYPLVPGATHLGRFDNGDARLNAWAVSWVAHRLVRDPLDLFDANTFYPLPNSLAFSEHLFVPGVLALPLLAATDDLVLTVNLLLVLAIVASALGMFFLARHLTGHFGAALLAGLFFSFAPFRFNRLPHLQMQLYAFLPLLLLALHRFAATRAPRWAWAAAALFVLQALSGTYLAAATAVALVLALAFLLPRAGLGRAELARLALALALAGLVLYPFARPYLWVHRVLGVEWDLEGIASLAATPRSYLASSSHLYRGLTERWTSERDRIDYLFPGLVLPALALAGLARWTLGGKGSRRTAFALCYGAIGTAGVVLSLGPATPVYPFLYEHVVFFRGLRALSRFALLPLLSASLLAAVALAAFAARVRRPTRWLVATGLLFVVESTALPYGLTPFRDRPPEVYPWLGNEAEPGPIVELPFRVLDTRYMFWARHHGFRPTLNGDSGFIPVSHQWMKVLFLRFPSPDAIALLRRLEVRYVVLHIGAFRDRALLRLLNGLEEHRADLLPVRDFGGQLVFEVTPARRPPAPRAALVPLVAHGRPVALFDGDRTRPWLAPGLEAELEIELGGPSLVGGLRLHYGRHPRAPARALRLWADGSARGLADRETTDAWHPLTELVLGLLADPADGTQDWRFEPVEASRLRVRVVGLDGPPDLTEVEVLAAPPPN